MIPVVHDLQVARSVHSNTECYYVAFLLVFTDYRPKTHDLEELDGMVSKIDETLKKVFPCQGEEEKRLFQLLRKAYVDARYKKDYVITAEELKYLAERIQLLRELTEELCKEEIEALQKKKR